MADERRAHEDNVPGNFFIDTTCIDCPICRQTAPGVFGDGPDQAVVVRQPETPREVHRAAIGMVSCPVGSIGARSRVDVGSAVAALPERIAGNVSWCGFASPDSYGSHSYFIQRDEGNVLVDSPRFTGPLVEKLEALGGVRLMYLTHQDDVADHEKFRRHFGAEGIIHETEAHGTLESIERKLRGDGPWEIAPDLKIIATPGHTRGHTVLLYRGEFLFTGDHLSGREGRLRASRRYNWFSWDEQIRSIEKLAGESFSWVLPGHGYRFHAPRREMRAEIDALLRRLKSSSA